MKTENEVPLDEKHKNNLLETVDKLEHDDKHHSSRRIFNCFFSSAPGEENGFKTFDYDKFCAMVYFLLKSPELLKTKLMKLLYYFDMIFYKENGISISGTKYAHLPYGPVPDNFDILIGTMTADHIAHIEVVYDNRYERHQINPPHFAKGYTEI